MPATNRYLRSASSGARFGLYPALLVAIFLLILSFHPYDPPQGWISVHAPTFAKGLEIYERTSKHALDNAPKPVRLDGFDLVRGRGLTEQRVPFAVPGLPLVTVGLFALLALAGTAILDFMDFTDRKRAVATVA